jgi:hypothetical protein
MRMMVLVKRMPRPSLPGWPKMGIIDGKARQRLALSSKNHESWKIQVIFHTYRQLNSSFIEIKTIYLILSLRRHPPGSASLAGKPAFQGSRNMKKSASVKIKGLNRNARS